MKKSAFVLFLALSIVILSQTVFAGPIGTPVISSPASGSAYSVGSSFTLTGEVSCLTTTGANCNNVIFTLNLPSGLSTSSLNPQGCGNLNDGVSCSKSWNVNVNSAGTYSITVGVTSSQGSATSGSISVSGSSTAVPEVTPAVIQPKGLSIDVVSPTSNQTFKRGDNVSLKIRLLVGGEQIGGGASAEAMLFSTTTKLFDDGLHDDGKESDGVYGNFFLVSSSYEGSGEISFFANHPSYVGSSAKRNITISPVLKVSAQATESRFLKGEVLRIRGSVEGVNGEKIPDANIDVKISLKNTIGLMNSTTSGSGDFLLERQISYGEPDGDWFVNVTVIDKNKNYGYGAFVVPVQTPPSAIYHSVKFMSPVEGVSYTRGETIKIAVEVVDAGNKVTGAALSYRTPDGKIVVLNETSPGIYSKDFQIGYNYVAGNSTLTVESVKTVDGVVRAGGNNLPITVNPAKLKLDLLSPTKTNFVIGETMNLKAKIFYPDGTSARNLVASASSPSGKEIFLQEKEPGIYESDYKIKDSDKGSWQLKLQAADVYANSEVAQRIILVGEITIFYLILQYWWVVAIGASPFAYLGFRFYQRTSRISNVKNLRDELSRTMEMKRDAQIKYYKEGKISEGTYRQMMKDLESKEEDVKTKLAKVKQEAGKKK